MTSSQVLLALMAILAVQVTTDLAVVGLGRRATLLASSLPYLVSGAAGVLLSTACLDLLPDAVNASGGHMGLWGVLLGSLLVLFCLQAVAHWFADKSAKPLDKGNVPEFPIDVHAAGAGGQAHAHAHSSARSRPGALLFGSALHSLVDGIAILAAFSASPRAGWSAALAVGLHELPHRTSDFALLLHLGVPQKRAMQLSILAGATAILGGLGVALLGQHDASEPVLLAISAATFLYISLVDLIPELHAHRSNGKLVWQVLALLGGAGLMAVIIYLPGDRT